MENQHKLIPGYRDFKPEEVALINLIKGEGEMVGTLVKLLEATLLGSSVNQSDLASHPAILAYMQKGCVPDLRALALAKTHLQTGMMWLVRAVAKPETFL